MQMWNWLKKVQVLVQKSDKLQIPSHSWFQINLYKTSKFNVLIVTKLWVSLYILETLFFLKLFKKCLFNVNK